MIVHFLQQIEEFVQKMAMAGWYKLQMHGWDFTRASIRKV